MLLICKELLLPQLAFVVRTVSPCSGMEPQDKSLRCHDIISLLGSNDHFTYNCSCSVYKGEWRLSVKTLVDCVHYWTLLKCNKEDCQQMWQNIWERYYLGNMGRGKVKKDQKTSAQHTLKYIKWENVVKQISFLYSLSLWRFCF